MSPVTKRHWPQGLPRHGCCSSLSTRNAWTMSSESFVANTLSIGAALLSLEHRGAGPISISTSAIDTGGRRHVPIPRAARIRKRSRWADHSEWEHSRAQTGVLDLLRWTHQAVRDLSGWCERLPGRSRKLLSELKGWAKNPSPSQRMESLLQSREDSGTISEWRDQENRENAVLPAPRSDTPSLDESPILLEPSYTE